MLFRVLLPEDAAAYQSLRLRGLQECPEAFASSYEEEAGLQQAEVAQRLSPTSRSAVFGAFQGNQLVALVGVNRENMTKLAHKAFIWGVYVAPEARQCGVGKELVSKALRHAAEAFSVKQVNLGVNTHNTAAVALYKKLGFNQYGLERGFLLVGGKFHDEYQMVWQVPGAA